MPLKVWLATYKHRHGTDTRVFSSESGALAWQWELADEWWGTEFPDEPRPPDDKIADEYFSGMADADKDMESFSIEVVCVESGELPPRRVPSQVLEDSWPVIRYGELPLTIEVMEQMPAYRKIAVVEVRLTHFHNQPYTVANIDQEWLVGECVRRMTGSEHGLCGVRVDETSIPNPTEGCLAYRVTALEVDSESLERELGNNAEKQ